MNNGRKDKEVLTKMFFDSASPAGQVAKDCMVVTIPNLIEIIRLYHIHKIYYSNGNLVMDYTHRKSE